YSSAIDRKALKASWLQVDFKEVRDGEAKTISFFAKKARGLMARYIVQNRIATREGLKGFDLEGYAFAPELSTAKKLVFVR
ncbi:MAG: peroxide stress protein YaaA, partial [Phycisphaerales bacterium]|nr:peroxide stress protein YaaA [Phycisphaerales bacterium]